MRAAARRLRSLVQGPSEAWLLCRMAAWAAVLPLAKHMVRLETLAPLMWKDAERAGDPGTATIVAMSRLLTRPTTVRGSGCYERSLLTYRFLSQRGADAKLVLAVKHQNGAVVGHAWVTVGGSPVDESEALEGFVPVAVYGRGGRLER